MRYPEIVVVTATVSIKDAGRFLIDLLFYPASYPCAPIVMLLNVLTNGSKAYIYLYLYFYYIIMNQQQQLSQH
jgi:hypothetical protein